MTGRGKRASTASAAWTTHRGAVPAPESSRWGCPHEGHNLLELAESPLPTAQRGVVQRRAFEPYSDLFRACAPERHQRQGARPMMTPSPVTANALFQSSALSSPTSPQRLKFCSTDTMK